MWHRMFYSCNHVATVCVQGLKCNKQSLSDGCMLWMGDADCCRYWCPACVRKACCPRHSQRVMSQFIDPVVAVDPAPADASPPSPVVLLLKQLPPNCSTILVACQPSHADVISGGSGVDSAACCDDCGRSTSLRRGCSAVLTPRHGRRRSGSGYSASARASPLPGYHRRASGTRSAAYFSPIVRPRTGSDGTCASCVAATSSSSCSVAVDAGAPLADGGRAGAGRRSWFRHIGVGESAAWRVRRRDTVAVYDDRCTPATDTVRIMPSAPSLPPSYSSICVTSWTQQQYQQPLSGSSPSVQTELKSVDWKSFEDI